MKNNIITLVGGDFDNNNGKENFIFRHIIKILKRKFNK